MILNNVKIMEHAGPVNICINGDKIGAIALSAFADDPLQLTFDEAFIFPGLINSHDHLDFNLYPQLGNKIYNNYTEWGKHLHENYKAEINQVLKIPVALRSRWGVFKNLLCGVTTVVNHGEPSDMTDDLITVFEKAQSLHSVQFDKKWKLRLNNPLKRKLPVAIHVGEGSDAAAFNEIDKLIKWNLLKRDLTGIHGVAMTEVQAKSFKALVWCPQSNYFLLNTTAPVNILRKSTKILFGTDSTLTSTWDIWDHLRMARRTRLLSDKTLYQTLNINPASNWKLNTGEIAPGKTADLVIAKTDNFKLEFDTFFDITPADILLVIHQGNIRLFDESMLPQLKSIALNGYSKVYVSGTCKYVQGDLPGLMKQISGYDTLVKFPVSLNQSV